jgi:hypothetical protein
VNTLDYGGSVMAVTTAPLSRDGNVVNRAGREAVAGALARHLDAGRHYTDAGADIDVEELRGWAGRERTGQ